MRLRALPTGLCAALLLLAAACGPPAADPGPPGGDPNGTQTEDPVAGDDFEVPVGPAPGDPTPVEETEDGVVLVDVARTAVSVYRDAEGRLVTDDFPHPNTLTLADEPLVLPAELDGLPWAGLDFFYPFVVLRDDGAGLANGDHPPFQPFWQVYDWEESAGPRTRPPVSIFQPFWQVYDWEEGAFVLTRDQLEAPLGALAADGEPAPLVRHLWLPSYAPDGTRLAFTAQICPRDGPAVCDGVVGFSVLATGEAHFTRVLELSPARRLTWSPDGTRLAYAVDWSMVAVVHRAPEELPLGIYVDNAADRQPELSAGHDFADYWSVAGLAWSPDGGEVRLARLSDPMGSWHWDEATQSYRPDEEPAPWVLDLAGGELRPVE